MILAQVKRSVLHPSTWVRIRHRNVRFVHMVKYLHIRGNSGYLVLR